MWLWRIAFPPIRALAQLVAPIRAEGLRNLPRLGGYILVANHVSWYDPPGIEFALGVPIRYMAKAEAFRMPLVGLVLRIIGNFPVRRGEGDRRALEAALRVVAEGHPLGFFPEGTRSRDGALRRAKPGIAFLARRSRAPLVPVAVTGTPRTVAGLLRRPPMRVVVGEAFTVDDIAAAADDQALADLIMRRVAALLPEGMRGAYRD